MATPWKLATTSWDIWQAGEATPAAIAARQKARFDALVRHARVYSPYYRALYRGLPTGSVDLQTLPVVTKPELMARFDDWATDPAIKKASVDAFVADQELVGQRYLGRYAVWTTSGTTGTPGIFLQDDDALRLYYTLGAVRAVQVMHIITPGLLGAFVRHGVRHALIAATDGHFAAASEVARVRQRYPWLAGRVRLFSVFSPLPELVRQLNAFQPIRLGGYTSALLLLAEEQLAGRLHIAPKVVVPAGEWLSQAGRERLGAAFRCPVAQAYGASECLGLALECPSGNLHVNTDWVLLEPVDEEYRPVPPGRPSRTVLLTNLMNRVQPLIRYDLGDSVTAFAGVCGCGSPLPAIRVEGRTNDTLLLEGTGWTRVPVVPLAIGTIVEETPGVRRFQVIQTGRAALRVRLEIMPGADPAATWEAVDRRLRDYLATQGLASVTIERADEPPLAESGGGKLRQVLVAPGAAALGAR